MKFVVSMATMMVTSGDETNFNLANSDIYRQDETFKFIINNDS